MRGRRKRAFAAFLGIALVTVGGACLGSQAVTLTREGKPNATIVAPDRPLASERFAAEELATYLKKMSGVELPIVADSKPPATRRGTPTSTSAA
ncbi:MAG: hypothetical protein JXQ73_13415 [Phycisphaerae bacterium]|nr:hypothetical protein [Phycisphaerae bacterium]